MHIINEVIEERSPLTTLTLLDNNNLAYATQYHGARLLDNKEHKTLLKIIHKELRLGTSTICFSPNATLLVFSNDNIINILDYQTKQIIKTIKTLSETINILTFCDNYIIAGCSNGRVFQYRYDNSALLGRICSFPYKYAKVKENFVSSIAVHANHIACSGKGGAIIVSDIHSQSSNKVLLEKGERINAMCFVNENILISADISGKIHVYSLETLAIMQSIDAPFDNIKQIILMPNPNFICVSGNTNYLSIIDISKAKVVHTKYVEFKNKISHILLANTESLLVVLDNNKMINFHLPCPKMLRECLIDNDIEAALTLSEDEPMLHDSMEYKLLEKRYNSLYEEALSALMNQNKTLALKTLSIVSEVKSKKKHIQDLFTAFENYNRFKVIYLEKKYAIAYAMAQKYEALKLTPLYIKLEETYKENFIEAQQLLYIGKDENAKALLNQYIPIMSKRPIVKLLLQQDKSFMIFLKALKNKNFQLVEELKTAHPIFMQTPTYVILTQTIKNNINKIDMLINEGKLDRAKELLLKFKNTSSMNKELKRLYLNLEQMNKLQNAYSANDFKTCYEILDSHHPLNTTPLGILLNKHWAKTMRECEEYALKANPNAIKDTLGSLLLVQTRRGKVGDLLRISFQSKIKAYLAKKSFRGAQNIIYSYLDIFGKDSEITSLMKTYETMSKNKLAITQEQKDKNSRDMWMESEFITDLA